MNLSDLGLNRYLYRDNGDLNNTNPVASAFGDITNQGGSSTGGSNTTNTGAANGLQPGSNPVVGVLLQSSAGDDRVEINPNDHFYAYNNGDVVVDISKDGIVADNIVVQNETVVNSSTDFLDVNDLFTYLGAKQPVLYNGEVLSSGSFVTSPPGWTIVRNSTGIYTITHNLDTDPCYVFCAPRSGHYRYQTELVDSNTFRISWEETSYGSVTVGVSGGGGGSVTVPGVRVAPGEVPVDVSFQFLLCQPILP